MRIKFKKLLAIMILCAFLLVVPMMAFADSNSAKTNKPATISITGVLRISDIEGRYFELIRSKKRKYTS